MKKVGILSVFILFVSIIANGQAQGNWEKAAEIVANLDPVVFPDNSYDILDFGAVGDNKTPCKQAFDKAIKKCSESGGGTIVVGPGAYYMDGPLVFKSNVHVELKEGAILNFSINEDDYLPAVLTRWEGTEVYNFSPLIYAYHVSNIALTGKGTINGNGSKHFANWKKSQKPDQQLLREMGRENIPVYSRVFGKGHKLRPGFFEPYGCSKVRIEGITILDSPFWVIHPIFCDNVIVRDVKVNSQNHNNDGCDPESSTNVLIEDCVFSTGDDAVAIKAGRDNDAWRIGRPTENVVVRNCTFRSKINGVCIGSEVGGGVRNVFIENIKIPMSSNTIYFKSNLDRGGYIENVFIRNIQADTVRTALVRFEPNYKGERSSFHPTRFHNFIIENVDSKLSAGCGFYLAGMEELPISNISLKNINISDTPFPYCMKNGKNIVFDNVKINDKVLDEQPKEIELIKLNTL